MQSEKNLYQADIQAVSLLKDMRHNVHNICKEHSQQKVRIEAIDGQIFEGVIVDYDDHNVYVEVEDDGADEEDHLPFQQVASRTSRGGGLYQCECCTPYGGYPYGDVSPYESPYPYGQVSPYEAPYPYGQVSPYEAPYPYGQVSPYADQYAYNAVSPFTGYRPAPYPPAPYPEPYPPYPPYSPYPPYPPEPYPPYPPGPVGPIVERKRRRRRRGCKIIPLALFTLLSIALI